MASLSGKTIASSYPLLLKIQSADDSNTTGIDSTLRFMEDGDGTASALKVSTTGVSSSGTFAVAGASTLTGDVSMSGALTVASSLTFGGSSTVISGSNAYTFKANTGNALQMIFEADNSEDNSDTWRLNFADGGNVTLDSYTSGSYVSKLTVENDGDVVIAGDLTVTGNNISGSGGAILTFSNDDVQFADSAVLSKDTAILGFGADIDITVHHVHNTGLAILNNVSGNTNSVTSILHLKQNINGTPAAGSGLGIDFETESSVGNYEIGMQLAAVVTDGTGGAEDFDYVIKLMESGSAAAERARITHDGKLRLEGNVIQASDGGNTITMDTSDNVTIAGDLTVTGNDLTFGNGEIIHNNMNGRISIIADTVAIDGSIAGSTNVASYLVADAGYDSKYAFYEAGALRWSMGFDGSDNTDYKLHWDYNNTSVAGASKMSLASDGDLTIAGGLTSAGPTIATRTSVNNLANDGEIPITATCVNIDANGGARTGIRFAGTGTAGQMIIVNNTGGEKLTFHGTEGTALVRGIHSDHDVMEANGVYIFISDGSLWNYIGGGVDSQPDLGMVGS